MEVIGDFFIGGVSVCELGETVRRPGVSKGVLGRSSSVLRVRNGVVADGVAEGEGLNNSSNVSYENGTTSSSSDSDDSLFAPSAGKGIILRA